MVVVLFTRKIWDVSKASKGRKGDKEKKDFQRGGHCVGKSMEEGKCRECLWNSPGTING